MCIHIFLLGPPSSRVPLRAGAPRGGAEKRKKNKQRKVDREGGGEGEREIKKKKRNRREIEERIKSNIY